jgi:hypothetical protein
MKSVVAMLYAVVVAIVVSCARQPESVSNQHAVASARTLVGRVMLPLGDGSRGVEVVVTSGGSESRRTWVLFDEQGHFAHSFEETPTRVTVSTGIRHELQHVDIDDQTDVNETGEIDIGAIDLRDRLTARRMMVRAAEGAAQGDARMALCFGLPPVGPSGGRMALGSRQFQPFTLGAERSWLLPHDADEIYLLVERGSGTDREWRSGPQQLFGPFTSAELPTELVMK